MVIILNYFKTNPTGSHCVSVRHHPCSHLILLPDLQHHSDGWGGKLGPVVHIFKNYNLIPVGIVCSADWVRTFSLQQQMESQSLLSSSTDRERELNGSIVEEHWSRANRVSITRIIQSYIYFQLKLWWLKSWRVSQGTVCFVVFGCTWCWRRVRIQDCSMSCSLHLIFLAGHAEEGWAYHEEPIPVLYS